jgi:hypothetical protein
MSVNLTIVVSDIAAAITAGYTDIKVYRSAEELSGFVEITIPGNLVPLVPGQGTYEYVDKNGTTEHWYRTTLYDSNTPAESTYSSSFKGTFKDTDFELVSYPAEALYTNTDHLVLDKVRTLIGDRKTLIRDYISPTSAYSSISEDGYTHSFSNPRGWPVSVTLDGNLYTSDEEPRVNDYQFITFSGVTINTTSGILDVWYYNFRFSDSEILNIYNALTPPTPLTEDQVTFELTILCTAVEALSGELRLSGVTSGTAVSIFEEISINPKGGLDSRASDLESLMKQKQKLIDDILKDSLEGGPDGSGGLFGVLID